MKLLLTRTQRRVLRLIVGEGMSYPRAAETLAMSERTVQHHVHNLRRKAFELDPDVPPLKGVRRYYGEHPELWAA